MIQIQEVFTLNINDVAREAGVSKTTVSRVLLNSDKVKPQTREMVLEVIKRMNYTPNTSAQMLAKKSNKVIGVISCLPINDPFYGYMSDMIGNECRKYDYGTIYVVSSEKKTGCEKEIAMLYGKVDAYILMGEENILPENVDRLIHMGMPVALFKTGIVKEGAITVDIDNFRSGETALRYLYRKGYRKIGYMRGGNDKNFVEGQDRYRGFIKAAEEFKDIQLKDFFGNRDHRMAFNQAGKIAESGIEALFCETDLMAYGVVAGLTEKGIRIPQNMAVLGFDDVKFTNFESVIRLSTVAQPVEKMAACMVGALVNRIENDVPYGKIQLFETRIVEGMTT